MWMARGSGKRPLLSLGARRALAGTERGAEPDHSRPSEIKLAISDAHER
jgi:hypothetical protein